MLQTSSLVQLTKALRSLMTDYEDISKGFDSEDGLNDSERIDALEVINLDSVPCSLPGI